jgi:hypothetical protein
MSAFPLSVVGHSPSLHIPWSLGLRVKFPSENYPRILYLFTRSDLKTILLPVVSYRINPLILVYSPVADPFCLSRHA